MDAGRDRMAASRHQKTARPPRNPMAGLAQTRHRQRLDGKKSVRITSKVNPPTAAVAMTRTCPWSAAMSEAGEKEERYQDHLAGYN
ncbi:UNVERIFIED_CONTAM: hypothetical protein FKN15_040854 [Acipenser sinensis]